MFEEKVRFAKKWFEDNKVIVPKGAKEWQGKSVRKREIPPDCSVGKLRQLNINVSDFIAAITDTASNKVIYNPINRDNIELKVGLIWEGSEYVNGHKKVNTKCINCGHVEILDYGTLQRMVARKAKYCRICRSSGGKRKPIAIYDKFEDFNVVKFSDSPDKLVYSCKKCHSLLERGMQHVLDSDYLVCDTCNPGVNTRIYTELGIFDSKIEYTVYKHLLTLFSEQDIDRQVPYRELFDSVKSNHRCDLYIIPIDVILEITTKNMNKDEFYANVLNWKTNISNNIYIVRSIKEVNDIVQPLMKVSG